MYCANCGNKILIREKFCSSCGQVISSSVADAPLEIPKKKTHPTLAVFIIWVTISIFQAFLISAGVKSSIDINGINNIFGIVYFILFIIFLGTLFSKPKTIITPTTKENLMTDKKKYSNTGKWITVFVFIFGFSALFIYAGNISIDPVIGTILVIVILVIFTGLLWRLFKKHQKDLLRLVNKIIKIIKFFTHNPILTIFLITAIVALTVFIYSVFVKGNYKSLEQALPSLQDNLAEASTAKLMGDSVVAGRWVPNMWMEKIAETATTTSDNLNLLRVPSSLKSYKESIIVWNDSIASAAAYVNPWNDLFEQPSNFSLSLNDSKVSTYINASLKKVALLKEAGDIAIKRQDRQTMYYVAGQLLVQEHWINNLYYSNNPGFLSFLKKIKLASPVMAKYTGFTPVVRKGPRCIVFTSKGAYVPKNCPEGHSQTPISFKKIMHAAVEYASAQPNAEEQWDKEWTADKLKIDLPETGQYIETQNGIYNGQPDLPPQLSQEERTFVDECGAKGGTTANTGGVYARMPTTESGMACHHGNGCWDYLTRSSRRYSGGNSGCPEENLLPPPPPTATPRPTRPPTLIPQPTDSSNQNVSSWDGEYSANTSGGCSGYGMSNSGIYLDRFSVRNNVVYTTLGESIRINSSGYAQISSSVAGFGYIETFQFYNSGGSAMVQGTIQLPDIQGVSCSLNFSGSRQ